MPAGRPTKYKEEYCTLLIEHMSEGYSYTSFAGRLLVHIDTLYEWGKVHPEFSEAKKIGKGASLFAYEKMMLDGANGLIDKFNSTAAVWFGKNVHNWTDKQEIDQTTNAKITIEKQDEGL